MLLLSCQNMRAQTAAARKAAAQVFTLTSYDANGQPIGHANGFVVGADGSAIGPWDVLEHASRAEATDAQGRKHEVEALMGANSIYNIAKFRISAASSFKGLPLAKGSDGQTAWVVSANGTLANAGIKSVETFMDRYSYCLLSASADESKNGCPVVNGNGAVVGMYLTSGSSASATDAAFARDFRITALSVNDPTIRQSGIRVALPSSFNDAQMALLMTQQDGGQKYEGTVNDFVRLFPTKNDGYWSLANIYIGKQQYADADRILAQAIAKADDKAESHYNLARAIYQYNIYKTTDNYPQWTLDKALSEATTAGTLHDEPLYKQLAAMIRFAQGNYQEAYDAFMALTKTPLRNAELYFQASQAKQRLGAADTDVLDLIDSAIAVCDTPYTTLSAPYFLARGLQLDKMGRYRDAMLDLYRYEMLDGQNCTGAFYFEREQVEMRGKMYQQALNDIAHACILSPDEPLYWAELGSANLLVRKYPEAEIAAKRCLALDASNSDALLILGVAQAETGRKPEGKQNIKKAKDLGNEQAVTFLEKYK